jgi:glycosyltransferase involved in cell wall biosynthesis
MSSSNEEQLKLASKSKFFSQFNKEKELTKIAATSNPLDVVFFIGDGVEEWTPKTIENTGMGGSELMACEISKRLARMGHKVRVYNSCGNSGEGIYDGVEYLLTNKCHDLECDVLVASRQAQFLSDRFNIKCKLRLLWVHDIYALGGTNELLLKADKILALSNWHKENMINYHNLHPAHIIQTRNGVDISRLNEKNIKRDKYKCVNFSSPDRSWPVLLHIWQRIKERVPQATLILGYGFANWEASAKHDPLQMDLIQRLKRQIKELEPLGVKYIGRVNQEYVAKEYLSAGAVLYPTFFTETSFIGGAECLLFGARFIGSSIAAINETIGDKGTLIPGDWTSKEYQDKFIEAAVEALLGE